MLELHLEGLKLDGVDALEPLSLQLQVTAPGPACRLAAASRKSRLMGSLMFRLVQLRSRQHTGLVVRQSYG